MSLQKAPFIGAALAVVLAAGAAHAHDDSDDDIHHALTANPIDLVNGQLNFEYELAPWSFLSFYGGANFLVWDGVWHADQDGRIFAVGPEVGVRLYPIGDAPEGLWVGPYAGLAFVNASRNGVEASDVGFYAGGMIGVNVLLLDVIILSGGVGLAYSDIHAVIDQGTVGILGAWPRFRLAAGFAF